MANVLTTQILQDGPRNVIVKLAGILDTAGALAAADLVDPATLSPIDNLTGRLATQLAIEKIQFSVSTGINVTLYWDATADVPILSLQESGTMDFSEGQFLQNNAGAGKTGKIQYAVNIASVIGAGNIQVFSVVLELVKQ